MLEKKKKPIDFGGGSAPAPDETKGEGPGGFRHDEDAIPVQTSAPKEGPSK